MTAPFRRESGRAALSRTWGTRTVELNVLCVKWGSKYPPDYVNRLYAMVMRNLPERYRFVCLTDDADGLRRGVEVLEIPDEFEYCWNKLHLFDRLPLDGTALFFDLDVVITGDLTPLVAFRPGDPFVGVFDWNRPRSPQFNASVMRFLVNGHHDIVDSFRRKVGDGTLVKKREWDERLGSNDKVVYWDGPIRYGGDQEWTSKRICGPGAIGRHCFPAEYVLSYRKHGRKDLPGGCRVMVFHGSPKPHEVGNPYVRKHWR